ncbi:winged helix-turn-helix transcriptional regulator [Actinomyces bowdenii]|uniref:winged helix-turn-helix transcriptional regulator n=1 Tax=Actinomyces bowdenii TaxID=131109 RepID=UPI002467AEEB|nr:helix-turn-helix domain-containing protein [Actinomyces bowdenii]
MQTLHRLERDGLVRRTVYPAVPAQVDHRLTAMGAGLTHLVKALADWSAANRESIAEARAAFPIPSLPRARHGHARAAHDAPERALEEMLPSPGSGPRAPRDPRASGHRRGPGP